jgi:hypothetical protein
MRKLKNFKPLCLLDDEHPGAEHTFVFPIYSARNNTTIITRRPLLERWIEKIFVGIHLHF